MSLLALGVLATAPDLGAQRGRRREGGEPLRGGWISDDLERGLRLARDTGKPLMIVFRCPP